VITLHFHLSTLPQARRVEQAAVGTVPVPPMIYNRPPLLGTGPDGSFFIFSGAVS
jgi:hypothetical protein